MFKINWNILRAYILLVIFLISIGGNYSNADAKNININEFSAGKYQENYNLENTNIREDNDAVEEHTKTSSNTVNQTPIEPEEDKTKSTKAQDKQKSIGRPVKAELTAYCNDPRCTGQSKKSLTAMQTETRLGVIAAPSNIPLGSKVYIPELKNYKADGMFNVEDRGGAIKVRKDGTYVIDVWVPTYEEAIKFGRKKTTIYLVE